MRTKNELYQEALRTVALRRQTARALAQDAQAQAEAAIPALRHAEEEVRVRGIRCALAGAAGKDRTEAAAALADARQKLTALLALLQGLEDHDMLADTASIALGDTHVELRYLDRFTVKLPLTGDLDYKLQALKAAVPEAEKKLGEQTTGTFDLTQESITAVYTPD